MKSYKWTQLEGKYLITLKIDGIQVIKSRKGMVSRAGKPLHNVPDFPGTKAEVFLGSFKKTFSAVRSKKPMHVPLSAVFTLEPMDKRLIVCTMDSPSPEEIRKEYKKALAQGYEGLVLHGEKTLKIKPVETYDLEIIDLEEGEGELKGTVGTIITPICRVGAGIPRKIRNAMWEDPPIGQIVEVACMGKTENGSLRQPRFVRLRPDKAVGR